MKPRGAPGVALVLTALAMSGCLTAYRARTITPPEVAKLGCYDLTIDWHLGAPMFPDFLQVRLDSSHAGEGWLMVTPPSRVGLHSHYGSWALLSSDSLLLQFTTWDNRQGIELRLGGSVDSLEGWARDLRSDGMPATTSRFSLAHAVRVDCPKD